jgi:four helix bundle protein
MNYQDWEAAVPPTIRQDDIWQLDVYRLSLFVAALTWLDIDWLIDDPRAWGIVDQLQRAVGSISTHVAEGYSLGKTQNRIRYYEYALGSARAARDWYYQSQPLLGKTITDHRLTLLTQLIHRLLKLLPYRPQVKRQESAYVEKIHPLSQVPNALLQNIPLPGQGAVPPVEPIHSRKEIL